MDYYTIVAEAKKKVQERLKEWQMELQNAKKLMATVKFYQIGYKRVQEAEKHIRKLGKELAKFDVLP